MSRPGRSSKPVAEDIWMKLERDPSLIETSSMNQDCTTFLVGDAGAGKSSIWQSFLKPTVTKEPKSTFALEYSFARKKSSAPSSVGAKSLAHVWELGGDVFEPGLLEIPLSSKTFATTSVLIVIDLSKPQNIIESSLRWIKAIREVVAKRMAELKATNNIAARAMKETARAVYAESPDKSRVKPSDIPVFIIASKWDTLKSRGVSSTDKRSILQALRFIAHYSGASLFCTSILDANLKDIFRGIMGSICFRTPTKSYTDAHLDKPVLISAGSDNFESILLGGKAGEFVSASADSKSMRLIRSEADLADFLTPDGITKSCWTKFREFFAAVFGPPEVKGKNTEEGDDLNIAEGGNVGNGTESNEFPESEIDAARSERDSALQRYVQEAERKEALLAKMYSGASIPSTGESETKDDMDSSAGVGGDELQQTASGGRVRKLKDSFEESKRGDDTPESATSLGGGSAALREESKSRRK